MMVRRYVVKDMPEAVVMIRKDLGKNAVILSSKRIRVKKWWGLWHIKRIEVLAATGDDVPVRVQTPAPLREEEAVAASAASAHELATEEAARAVAATVSPEFDVESDSAVERVFGGGSDTGNAAPTPPTDWSLMQHELAEMRALLQAAVVQVPEMDAKAAVGNEQSLDPLQQTLIRQGVAPTTARALLANSVGEADVAKRIVRALDGLGEARPIGSTSRLCAFVGPTGVGKTTTVAKIAALNVLAGKRKVGLVTTDTYRIAAVEQLKTYASILHVPLQVVQNPSEFPVALDRLSNCDLVLIDTAGRSYRKQEQVEEISHLLSMAPIDETYLVMSLTSKPDDLRDLVGLFRPMRVDKFLFTKMDETESIGTILTLLHEYQKPMSYVTTGQNVPDDIEIPSLDKLVRTMVGGVA